MAVMNLPLHDLPFDNPRESEVFVLNDVGKIYQWIMTDTEKAHIATMLDVSDAEVPLIKTRANMFQERMVCRGCNKHSGIDDLIHNALYMDIHSKTFMLETVKGTRKSDGNIDHEIICSCCGTLHEGKVGWPDAPQIWYC
ncbi:RBP protein [Aspergillus californicus]